MLNYIDTIKDDWTALTMDMIRIPSHTGSEKKLSEFILEYLRNEGIEESFIDGAGNVVSVIRGSGKGPDIMLNGHLDTVIPGSLNEWSPYDPYNPVIDDKENIIGLGTCDMKSGLAVLCHVMKIFAGRRNRIELPGDLIFSAVVYEEAAQMLGMQYLLEETFPKNNLKADVVFLAEPTTGKLAIGQRGKIELVAKTRGKCAHASTPELGINALEKMIPVMDKIFKKSGITVKKDPLFGESSINITNCIVRPGVGSTIPDECEISIDRRYLPDETIDNLMEEINKIFNEIKREDPEFNAKVEPRYSIETSYTGYSKKVKKYHPPWKIDSENYYVKKTLTALENIGIKTDTKYWNAGTDGSMSCAIHGIPTIGFSMADEKWNHKAGERVSINNMIKTLEGYVSIISTLMNLPRN